MRIKFSLLILSCLLYLNGFSNKSISPSDTVVFSKNKINSNTQLKMSGFPGLINIPPDEFIPRQGIGVNGGWGSPYGFGVQYNYLFIPHIDVNAGLGFSLSGLRIGAGTRFHFMREGNSPFFGVNYAYTTGISGLEISINDETGEFKIFSDQAFFVRGGYKIETSNFQALFNAGYGFAVDGLNAEYQRGDYSSALQDFADLQALGGIEISVTLVFRIGRKKD